MFQLDENGGALQGGRKAEVLGTCQALWPGLDADISTGSPVICVLWHHVTGRTMDSWTV
jgi:hypothetical protein